MKKVCEVITYIAALAFFLSLCSIETLEVKPLVTLMVSSIWLVGYGVCRAESNQASGGR